MFLKKKYQIKLIRPIIVILLVLLLSCQKNNSYRETRLAISDSSTIPVSFIVYGSVEPEWNMIFDFIEKQANLYDYRNTDGPVGKINSEYLAEVPENLYNLIGLSKKISEISYGAFDPTILPVLQLWDFTPGAIPPEKEKINKAIKKVDFRKIEIKKDRFIRIPHGFGLDLGGIAKGAIVDACADLLESQGYNNFLIEAGGDIILSGVKPQGKKWIVGIKNPRNRSQLFRKLYIGEAGKRIAIVTSGDYERFFEYNKKRYHHILNPSTGYPADKVISVTIIANNCILADGFSTASFVLGFEDGCTLIEQQKDTEGLFVRESEEGLQVKMTEGFSSFLEVKSISFKE